MTQPRISTMDRIINEARTVLAGAIERLNTRGWTKDSPHLTHNGVRLADAINYASANAAASPQAHRVAFAAVAFSIDQHTGGMAGYELLAPAAQTLYLDERATVYQLHRLDVAILHRYNATRCAGYEDAATLLNTAYGNIAYVATFAAGNGVMVQP